MNDPSIKLATHVQSQKFETEQQLLDFVRDDTEGQLLCGVVFGDDYTDYTIRISGFKIVDSSEEPISDYARTRQSEMTTVYQGWANLVSVSTDIAETDKYNNVFIYIQKAVDSAIIQLKTGGSVKGYTTKIGKLSEPAIHYNSKINESSEQKFDGIGPYLMFIIIGQIFHISNRIMEEKENKIKEGLVAVGANPYILFFAWEIIYFPFSLFLMVMIYIFDPSNIFGSLNPILYVLLLLFYIISMYSIVVIITNLVKKYRTVLVMICLFVSCMLTLSEMVYNLKLSGNMKIHRILCAIFPFFSLGMAGAEVGHEDDHGRFIGFGTMFDSDFGINFVFLFVDAVVYFLLAILFEYLHGIDFRSFGVSKSEMKKELVDNEYAEDIQEDPVGSECFVEVKNIYKFFKFRRNIGTDNDDNDKKLGKVFAANRNISFKVYKDEIFGILGHNGAGKSTLIQNMVGIIRPDGGETIYRGLPLSKNKKEIHRQLGICLQSNVIIEGFTVADHYKLYSGIKGVSNTEEDLQSWLREIDLVEKRDYEVEKMSGGQKRKLCIGLALIGNPKFVFLDEPTTGLDPLSRRKIWNLLLKLKKDRVIFITTHYMDEADIIADRKLILNRGSIRCLGSSVYLKSHFHMKYSLEVETTSPDEVGQLIKQHIPEAEYYNNKTELVDDQSIDSNINLNINTNSDSTSNSDSSSDTNTNFDSTSTTNININTNTNFDSSSTSSTNIITDTNTNSKSNSNTYTWKLPIQSSPLFSSLLKDLENERGKRLNNFSLNAPLLEELFVSLERQMEKKRNGEEVRVKAKDLPKTQNVKRPGMLNTALRLCRYRLKAYLRQKTYLFMGIVVPIGAISFFVPVLKEKLDKSTFSNYGSLELSSSKVFPSQQWNYDFDFGGSNNNSISKEIMTQEFQGGKLNFLNKQEMIKQGKTISTSPYFVSSFSSGFSDGLYNFDIYYNDSMVHSLPVTLNTLSNAILASNQINDTIRTYSQPLGYFNPKIISEAKLYSTLVFTFCIAFPLSFYGMNAVRERVQKLLKQLQLNGISNKSYWFSVLISDHLVFMVTCVLIIGAIIVFRFNPLFYVSTLSLLAVFIIISGVACLLFQYCLSFVFKSDANAFIIFFAFNVVPTFSILIKSFSDGITADEGGEDVGIVAYLGVLIVFLTAIFPNYGISRTVRTMINAGIEHESINTSIGIFSLLSMKNQIFTCLLGEIIGICFYSFILKLLTNKTYNPKKGFFETPKEIDEKYTKELKEGDDDILKEYRRVYNDDRIPIRMIKLAQEYDDLGLMPQEIGEALKRDHASKYGEFHMSDKGSGRIVMTAFENVSLGVDKRECFGILGPNGSGKSSLLNTASFTFPQTVGKIYYDGKDTVERKGNEITLGYCPQEDALWNEYSLYEHIEMFLYLRGHSKKESKRIAKEFINYCRLTEHKNKMPSELSGGTRRKLNILLALCCSSTKIIMDEPSAGMDPSTRRYVWDIIKTTLQTNDSSTIMSTHSMEEAELLCNRIAIMVKGKIRCIGTPEHLKMKYGNTYILDVHTDDIEKFHNEIVVGRKLFGESEYEREVKSLQRIKYEVRNNNNISRVFEIMEDCRKSGIFTDYSYSQTSLEQVFLNFANKYGEQEEEENEEGHDDRDNNEIVKVEDEEFGKHGKKEIKPNQQNEEEVTDEATRIEIVE